MSAVDHGGILSMPELHWRPGYAYALGLMLALAAGLWGFFKRKGWL